MKVIQIKGEMIPKVLELLEAKRSGNQPILSFHSSQTPDADVYSLYLDDLIDYIEYAKGQAVKDTAKEIWNDITSYYFALRVLGNATVELNKLAEFWYNHGVEVE